MAQINNWKQHLDYSNYLNKLTTENFRWSEQTIGEKISIIQTISMGLRIKTLRQYRGGVFPLGAVLAGQINSLIVNLHYL